MSHDYQTRKKNTISLIDIFKNDDGEAFEEMFHFFFKGKASILDMFGRSTESVQLTDLILEYTDYHTRFNEPMTEWDNTIVDISTFIKSIHNGYQYGSFCNFPLNAYKVEDMTFFAYVFLKQKQNLANKMLHHMDSLNVGITLNLRAANVYYYARARSSNQRTRTNCLKLFEKAKAKGEPYAKGFVKRMNKKQFNKFLPIFIKLGMAEIIKFCFDIAANEWKDPVKLHQKLVFNILQKFPPKSDKHGVLAHCIDRCSNPVEVRGRLLIAILNFGITKGKRDIIDERLEDLKFIGCNLGNLEVLYHDRFWTDEKKIRVILTLFNHKNLYTEFDPNRSCPTNERTPLLQLCYNMYKLRTEDKLNESGFKLYRLCVNQILNMDADVNAKDKKGCTALLYLCRIGWKCHGLTKELISRGADINAANNKGETPLAAAYSGKFKSIKIMNQLLDNGVDISEATVNGWTPLMHCIRIKDANGDLELIQRFIHVGCDPNLVTKEKGKTLLMLLIESKRSLERKKEILKRLLKFTPDLTVQDTNGFSAVNYAQKFEKSLAPFLAWQKKVEVVENSI